jgi:hypothetical protein
MEELRMSILSESDPLGSKRRFGLFSQPISTAVGDDGAFRNKIRMIVLIKIREIRWASLSLSPETSLYLL